MMTIGAISWGRPARPMPIASGLPASRKRCCRLVEGTAGSCQHGGDARPVVRVALCGGAPHPGNAAGDHHGSVPQAQFHRHPLTDIREISETAGARRWRALLSDGIGNGVPVQA
jgi:hypothetical protein